MVPSRPFGAQLPREERLAIALKTPAAEHPVVLVHPEVTLTGCAALSFSGPNLVNPGHEGKHVHLDAKRQPYQL